MAVEIPLKRKYTIGGRAQAGYKTPAGGGDSTKRRPNYHKQSDAWKKAHPQRRKTMILGTDLKIRFEYI